MHRPETKRQVPLGSAFARSDPSDPVLAAWQWHIDNGSIATDPGMTPEHRARIMANERILYGPPKKPRLTG